MLTQRRIYSQENRCHSQDGKGTSLLHFCHCAGRRVALRRLPAAERQAENTIRTLYAWSRHRGLVTQRGDR